MSGVEVNTDLLRDAAAKTQHVSDRITDALTTLQSNADGLGSPWGDDVYGYKFARGDGDNGYLAAQKALHSVTNGMSDHSTTHAEAQQTSAKYHENIDEGTAHYYE